MDKYLVVSGNEFGVDIDNIDFIFSYELAEEKFKDIMQEFGCAQIYKVGELGLEYIKGDCQI